MEKQIIELANENQFLSIKRGFLCITTNEGNNIAQIPIDNILSVIISANNATISKNTINALTENNAVIVFCGKNYMPSSIAIPCSNHWQNGERIRKQIEASTTLQKSLCKTIIKEKISNQAKVLQWFNPESTKISRLKELAKSVKSGDSGNNEAIAAQIYFKELFGKEFTRNRGASDVNALLNYTYIILRACVARAVTGAGLLPSLGIIHTNKLNPFTLVDDLIEPYRPLADSVVYNTMLDLNNDDLSLTTDIKRKLTEITSLNLESVRGQKSLPVSLFESANSLAKSYIEKKNLLEIDKYIDTNELIK